MCTTMYSSAGLKLKLGIIFHLGRDKFIFKTIGGWQPGSIIKQSMIGRYVTRYIYPANGRFRLATITNSLVVILDLVWRKQQVWSKIPSFFQTKLSVAKLSPMCSLAGICRAGLDMLCLTPQNTFSYYIYTYLVAWK